MTERIAWLTLFSWLVLAWWQVQQPAPSGPAQTSAPVVAQGYNPAPSPDPATSPAPPPSTTQADASPSTQPTGADVPAADAPPSARPAPVGPAEQAAQLLSQAKAEPNAYRKARMLLDADDLLLTQPQLAEARRTQLLALAITDCRATPLAAEACARYIELVMNRPNPGRPADLIDRLSLLARTHGVGPGMVERSQLQRAIDKLTPTYSRDADYLRGLLPPTEPAGPDQPAPDPLAPLKEATLRHNPLKLAPVMPEPGRPHVVQITVENPSTTPMIHGFEWTVAPGTSWKVEPAQLSVALAPGQSRDIRFELTVSGDDRLAMTPGPALRATIEALNQTLADRAVPVKSDMARYYQKLMIGQAPQARQAPRIDGRLDDAAWAQCLPMTHFISPDASRRLEMPTDVRVCWDNTHVYVGARLTETDMPGVTTAAKRRNESVWIDDSLEVMLDFAPERRGFVQFIVNANNVPLDAIGYRVRWDTIWTSEVTRDKDGWTLEMALPWEALATAPVRPGERIGFQLVRNRNRRGVHEYWQWSPTLMNSNLVPDRFGTLVFTGPIAGPIPGPVAGPPPAR